MKIEVYNNNLDHIITCIPTEPRLSQDNIYQFNLDIPILPIGIDLTNCIAVVSSDTNEQIFVGYITLSETNRLTIATILDKFDILTLPGIYEGAIEDYIYQHIYQNFVSSPDTLRNIDFLEFDLQTQTQGKYEVTDNETFKLTLTNIFKQFNIIVVPKFIHNEKKITLSIFKSGTFKTKLSDDIQGVSITSKISSSRKPNSCSFYEKGTNNYLDTYVLLIDGTITTLELSSEELRIPRVVFSNVIYDSTQELTMEDVAKQILSFNTYNHNITVDLLMDIASIDYNSLGIGNFLELRNGSIITDTIITGVLLDFTKRKVILTCGFERISKLKKGNNGK